MQVIFHNSGFFDEMRCSLLEEGKKPDPFDPLFQNDINPGTGKLGIRHYSPIVALFWRILNTLSLGKIDKIEVIDSQKGKVYLDKESFIEWKNWKKIDGEGEQVTKTQEVVAPVFRPQVTVDLEAKARATQEKEICIKEYNEKMNDLGDRVAKAIDNEDHDELKKLNEESVRNVENHEINLSEMNKKIDQYSDQTPKPENGSSIVPIPPSKTATYPIYMNMLSDLEKGSPTFREIFEIFFSHFSPDVLKSWKKDPQGSYTGTLTKPIKLWVPQGTKDDPRGGIIIMIGNNDEHKITLSIDQKNHSIKVANGLNLCCETQIGIVTDRVSLVEFACLENNIIKTEAGVKVPLFGFLTKEKITTKERLIKSWKKGSALKDSQSPEEFIAQQIRIQTKK